MKQRFQNLGLERIWPSWAIVLVACLLIVLAQHVRPMPFSTTDDNFMYFLPLIKSHTDSLLSGHLLRMDWSIGAGWSPMESGQIGLFYVPYHLSNLIARVLGDPMLLLEVSAAFHLAMSGLFVFFFLPQELPRIERVAWSCYAMVQPAPVLLGLNWHNYLTFYPWLLAIGLLVYRDLSRSDIRGVPSPGLFICSLGLFLTAHPQMYVLGILILSLCVVTLRPDRTGLRHAARLAIAQIPFFTPLIFFKWASMDATANWMADRANSTFILSSSQPFGTVLRGLIAGNLVPGGQLQLWGHMSWTGIGIFFLPALIPTMAWLVTKQKWLTISLLIATMAFMGIQSFPWMRHLAIGPLEGFRWTWKFTIFLNSLIFLLLAPNFHGWIKRPNVRLGVISAFTIASCLVCTRGLTFDLWPGLSPAHPLGASGVVREASQLMAGAGVSAGARVATLGGFDMDQPQSLPRLATTGNAPLLLGVSTLAIFEPLEPAEIANVHMNLSLPWRTILSPEAVEDAPDQFLREMAKLGVTHILCTPSFKGLGELERRTVTDSYGRSITVIRLPQPFRFPHQINRTGPAALECLPGGNLRTFQAQSNPPVMNIPRRFEWKREPDGRWSSQIPLWGQGWWWFGGLNILGFLALTRWLKWPSNVIHLDASGQMGADPAGKFPSSSIDSHAGGS